MTRLAAVAPGLAMAAYCGGCGNDDEAAPPGTAGGSAGAGGSSGGSGGSGGTGGSGGSGGATTAGGSGGASAGAAGSAQAGSSGQAGSSAQGGASGSPGSGVADLRADVNRDGTVDVDGDSDEQGEDTWDKDHGAIFIANIDDDQDTCPKGNTLSDADLAACNDAVDDVVNGDDDLLDLARLKTKPWAAAPDDAVGQLSLSDPASGQVRLFKAGSDGTFNVFDPAADSLTAAELRAGVEFAIEGKDILRDDSWDGFVDVTFTITSSAGADATDTVKMRLAPVLTRHHLDPAEHIYVAKLNEADSTAMRNDLKKAITAAAVPNGLDELSEVSVDGDQWTQDYFETAYMSMPAAGGQHIVNVFYRSANVYGGGSKPLRPAGRVVFTHLRGKDAAGVQQFDVKHEGEMDSLNSFGNLETIPPYTLGDKSYPLGRVIRGNISSFHPDKTFLAMVEAQKVQPPVYIDTSWLLVGHVDETMSFLKAPTPRGWVLVVNDAQMAHDMFQAQADAGHGDVKVFEGQNWLDDSGKEYTAETTIAGVLADTDVMKTSQEAASEVEGQLEIVKEATGLTDDEIIHIPYLHMSVQGYSIAYQPGTVNGIYLSDTVFGAPNPHGPVIDGKDIFKAQMEDAFGKVGVTVAWIEDWDLYHRLSGEVHCGTNTRRTIPDTEKWWESGY